jgi:hypothetical protein
MNTTLPDPQEPGQPAPASSGLPPNSGYPVAPAFAPPSAFVAPPIPRRRSSLLTSVLLAAAAAVAVAGIAFAAGRLTAPVASASTTTGRFGGLGGGQGFAGRSFAPGAGNGLRGAFGGVGLRGTVTAVSGDTITVKLANGTEIKVQTNSSTTYHQQASGSASDVTSGKSVIVELQGGTGGFGSGGGTTTTPTVKASDITVTGQ